jgi:hypothetical protein
MYAFAQFRPEGVIPGLIVGAVVGMVCYGAYKVIAFVLGRLRDYQDQFNDRPY